VVYGNEGEVVMGMVMLAASKQNCVQRFQTDRQSVRDAIIVDVTVFSPISTIRDATYILRKTGCNYIAVFDGSELVGILSRLQLEEYAEGQYGSPPELLVRHVMSPVPLHARTYDRLVTVREAMIQKGLSWLPVLDEKGKLAGVLLSS
jgi:CBS domain-containing protein